MPKNKSYLIYCASTIFIGAFLLFQVQPLISKMILPWFGGTPMVWTTCMLFFQVLLLLGYAYAHFLAQLHNRYLSIGIHVALLIGALCTLPIMPDSHWKPTGNEQNPVFSIMALLLVHVGLPYFLLASTGPLVQFWYGQRFDMSQSTYRLYAISNASSLLALLSYPIVFEVYFDLTFQGKLWSYSFLVFAALFVFLSLLNLKTSSKTSEEKRASTVPPPWSQKILWIFYPFCAVWILLAGTNHVCQDVAVIPFLWILPLSLYLITFIICFDKPEWYKATPVSLAICMVVGGLSCLHFFDPDVLSKYYVITISLYSLAIFLACFYFHGELVKLRPNVTYLTHFYMLISAGGALGGVFVTLVCPAIFTSFNEMNWILMGIYVCSTVYLLNIFFFSEHKKFFALKVISSIILVPGMVMVIHAQSHSEVYSVITKTRNFYGTLTIHQLGTPGSDRYRRSMSHGAIVHGTQSLTGKYQNVPTSYYGYEAGLGLAIASYPKTPIKVAMIGLGAGTALLYGKKGDLYHIYEINPDVIKLAKEHFTYIDNTQANTETFLGDARLKLENKEAQNYDVIILDAFSGDAVPVHLITQEAIALYRKHLKPGGLIAIHISNRYLDLYPVIYQLSKFYKMPHVYIQKDINKAVDNTLFNSSSWVIMTDNQKVLNNKAINAAKEDSNKAVKEIPLWTDQYSNLFSVMK